ncbi:MAG: hypothetical protein V7723_10735 [Sneathiella sp.]|uniref:hypothetical protein n=1 Tax=Sneathiella sp. TaxID=1964365 RepID=UPI0030024B80
MTHESLDRQQIEILVQQDPSFAGLDISRFSTVFMVQFLQMLAGRTINVHQMMGEIRFMEEKGQPTQTKNALMFRHPPLKGLMKKHFTDASFIVKNIGIHFGLQNNGNRKLDQLIEKAFRENTSGYVDDQFIGCLADGMTMKALEARASRKNLTGEWIVFQKDKGKYYYLTLASHTEDDETIYGRVCDSYEVDFPFLRKTSDKQY